MAKDPTNPEDPFATPPGDDPVAFDPVAAKNRINKALDLGPDPEPTPPVEPEPQVDPEPPVEPDPEPTVDPEPTPPVEPEPSTDPEPPVEPDPEPTVDPDDDSILDLDQKIDEPKGEEAYTEEELEELRKDDSAAVEQAREKGRLAKRLKADLDESQIENDRLIQENETLRAEVESSKVNVNPTSHPEFRNLRDSTRSSILRQTRSLPFPIDEQALEQNWGTRLADLKAIDTLPYEQQEENLNGLRVDLAKQLRMIPTETDVLTWEEDPEAMGQVNQVIGLLQNHLSEFDKMQTLYASIQEKAEKHQLSTGYDDYTKTVSPYRDSMNALVALSDEEIEQDPDSLESIAAKRVQTSPEMSKRYKKVVDTLTEAFFGPRALTQEELDRISATGKDMAEFHKNREKRVDQIRQEWMPQIAMLLALKPDLAKAIVGDVKAQEKKVTDDARKLVTRDLTRKKADPKPEPTAPPAYSREVGLANIGKALDM